MPEPKKSTDAIVLLKEDHKKVEGLFKQFEDAKISGASSEKKGRLADQIVKELAIHTHIEEQVFYPAVRGRFEKAEEMVLEAEEEHHAAKALLVEVHNMKPIDERFDAKMKVLIEMVRHHKKEEESELMPQVRKAFKRKEMQDMGQRLLEAKKIAPSTPSAVEVAGESGRSILSNIATTLKSMVGMKK